MERCGIPVRVHVLVSHWAFSKRNDFSYSTFFYEHVLAVPPDDQDSTNDQKVRVIWLRIRKNRVHERKMEECRQQNAATGPVEQCSCDDAYRQTSGIERRERPLALLGTAQQKGRQMPQPPYDPKNHPSPDRSELPLEKRKCETPPAELLDRAFDGGQNQCDEQSPEGRKWKRFRAQVSSNCGTDNEDQRNANDQKSIPGHAAAPEQCPSEEAPHTCEATVVDNKNERRNCRGVYGQKKERMVTGELAKKRSHPLRQKDVHPKDTPSQAEGDEQKWAK